MGNEKDNSKTNVNFDEPSREQKKERWYYRIILSVILGSLFAYSGCNIGADKGLELGAHPPILFMGAGVLIGVLLGVAVAFWLSHFFVRQ